MSKLNKEFGVSSWAIDNSKTVYVIIVILFIGGLISYSNMPRESFPEVVMPQIYVSSVYPGNTPEDVEKFVTKPLEDEIKNISGVVEITSTSLQDYSMIIVEFDEDILPEEAKRKVKDQIDMVKGTDDWPTLDAGQKVEPNAFDLDIGEFTPIMNINLRGEFTTQQLKKFGEHLEDEIEDLIEIKEVNIRGVQDMEVEVAVDIYKMTAANVNINDVMGAIQSENVTISGGNIISNNVRRNVRVVGEIDKPKDLENIVIKSENGAAIYLRDIAQVNFREKDRTSYSREYGESVIMLDVMKKSGQNLISAAEKIYKIIAENEKNRFPEQLTITVTSDQSTRTKAQVSELENSIILGVLLVIGVLMFFLGVRNALFVGIAIPLSMLLAFLILSSMGITLNTMTLFASVVGLGMLVDNGIVVVENVYRLMDEGVPRLQAAKQGVGEIAWPIIASTATTLAAFLPLGLWPGVMGDFMIYLPLTLSTVLGSSLFVALVINSMLTSVFMKTEEEEITLKKFLIILVGMILFGGFLLLLGSLQNKPILVGFGNLFILIALLFVLHRYVLSIVAEKFQTKLLVWLENLYERVLRFALKGRRAYLFFFGSIGLLFVAFILFGLAKPKVLFFPDNQPNQAIVYIEYPEGTDIEKTNELTQKIEQTVLDILAKYEIVEDGKPYNYMAESIISVVGEGAGNPQTDGGMDTEMPHKGKVMVLFREYKYRRGVLSEDVLSEIREKTKGHPGVSVIAEKDHNGPPVGYAINIEVTGEDYDKLMQEATLVKAYIDQLAIPGIEELKLDVNRNKPEKIIKVDRQKAGELGVSTAQIGTALRQAIYGFDVSTYKDTEEDYDIYVRFDSKSRYDESALVNQNIIFRDSKGVLKKVPISSLVTAQDISSFSSIKRKNLKRLITIYSNVLSGYNASEIVAKIERNLDNYEWPDGIRPSFTGEQEEMAKNMDFLSKALMIALALISLVIVAQFNSISKPLIILGSVILSFIGVLFGLVISGDEFVVMMTMLGIIALAGIVVNNAIVLIDYTQLLIDRRKEELGVSHTELLDKEEYFHLIVQGGKSRLRPVLLTAITTIFGLIPLAIGFNIDFLTLLTEYNANIYIGGDNAIFWSPMSWTIIYGLSFATFLTLIIVPVMFFLLNRIKIRMRKK